MRLTKLDEGGDRQVKWIYYENRCLYCAILENVDIQELDTFPILNRKITERSSDFHQDIRLCCASQNIHTLEKVFIFLLHYVK